MHASGMRKSECECERVCDCKRVCVRMVCKRKCMPMCGVWMCEHVLYLICMYMFLHVCVSVRLRVCVSAWLCARSLRYLG